MLGSDFSKEYNIFGCCHRFLEIKEKIVWTPFIKTFHYFQQNCHEFMRLTQEHKLDLFVSGLTFYSGKDIRTDFSQNEWNTIVNKIKT